MHPYILKNKSTFAESLDWCEDNLKPMSWRYNIEWKNGNPFDPSVVFDFDSAKDRTVFALKFS